MLAQTNFTSHGALPHNNGVTTAPALWVSSSLIPISRHCRVLAGTLSQTTVSVLLGIVVASTAWQGDLLASSCAATCLFVLICQATAPAAPQGQLQGHPALVTTPAASSEQPPSEQQLRRGAFRRILRSLLGVHAAPSVAQEGILPLLRRRSLGSSKGRPSSDSNQSGWQRSGPTSPRSRPLKEGRSDLQRWHPTMPRIASGQHLAPSQQLPDDTASSTLASSSLASRQVAPGTGSKVPGQIGAVQSHAAGDMPLVPHMGHLAVDCMRHDTTSPVAQGVTQLLTTQHLLQFGALLGESSAELALTQASACGAQGPEPECLFGCTDSEQQWQQGWELVVQEFCPTRGLHYTAWRRYLRKGLYAYKSRTVFEGITAEQLGAFQCDVSYKMQWDELCSAQDLLAPPTCQDDSSAEAVTDLQQLCAHCAARSAYLYARTKFPTPMAQREYVYARRVWAKADDGGCYVLSRSTDHPTPPAPGCRVVRVQDYVSGCVLRESQLGDRAASEMVTCYFEDSHVAGRIMNMGVRKALWPMVQKMEVAIRNHVASERGAAALRVYKAALAAAVSRGLSGSAAAAAPAAAAGGGVGADLHLPSTVAPVVLPPNRASLELFRGAVTSPVCSTDSRLQQQQQFGVPVLAVGHSQAGCIAGMCGAAAQPQPAAGSVSSLARGPAAATAALQYLLPPGAVSALCQAAQRLWHGHCWVLQWLQQLLPAWLVHLPRTLGGAWRSKVSPSMHRLVSHPVPDLRASVGLSADHTATIRGARHTSSNAGAHESTSKGVKRWGKRFAARLAVLAVRAASVPLVHRVLSRQASLDYSGHAAHTEHMGRTAGTHASARERSAVVSQWLHPLPPRGSTELPRAQLQPLQARHQAGPASRQREGPVSSAWDRHGSVRVTGGSVGVSEASSRAASRGVSAGGAGGRAWAVGAVVDGVPLGWEAGRLGSRSHDGRPAAHARLPRPTVTLTESDLLSLE